MRRESRFLESDLSRANLQVNVGETLQVFFEKSLGVILSDLLPRHRITQNLETETVEKKTVIVLRSEITQVFLQKGDNFREDKDRRSAVEGDLTQHQQRERNADADSKPDETLTFE